MDQRYSRQVQEVKRGVRVGKLLGAGLKQLKT